MGGYQLFLISQLTKRQLQILWLLVDGKTVEEIADVLSTDKKTYEAKTVSYHINRLHKHFKSSLLASDDISKKEALIQIAADCVHRSYPTWESIQQHKRFFHSYCRMIELNLALKSGMFYKIELDHQQKEMKLWVRTSYSDCLWNLVRAQVGLSEEDFKELTLINLDNIRPGNCPEADELQCVDE